MSRHQTPNTTPFIPPLASPQSSPRHPPVIPSPSMSGSSIPSWGPTPQNAGGYPVYPNSPYGPSPFIPHMTPGGMSAGGFLPPSSGPATAPLPPQGGVSLDYTGYPQFPQNTPWPTQAPNLPPISTNVHWSGPMSAPPQVPPSTPMWAQPRPMGYPQFAPPQPAHPSGYPGMAPPGHAHGGWGPPPGHAFTPLHPTQQLDPWGNYPPAAPQWGGPPMQPNPPPQAPLSRAEAQVGDRMNPFAIGEHYGPVLDPFLVRIVRAPIKINPLIIAFGDEFADRPHLKWNMLFPSNYVQRSTDPSHISWSNGRDEPATFPRITSLRLVSETLPWMIEIQARNPDIGVTCGEVIDQLSSNLNKLSSKEDYEILSRQHRQSLTDAYRRNRSREHGVPGGQLGEGMKRLDFLRKSTMFGGLEFNDRVVKMKCGDALPCTFVLKCSHRYQLTPQEVRDQEARQRATNRPSGRSTRNHSATVISDDDDDDEDDDD